MYLTVKLTNETGTRYAKIFGGRIRFNTSMDSAGYDASKLVREIILTVEREPYWRSHIPLTLPTAADLGAPQAPGTQASVLKQYVSNFRGAVTLDKIYAYDANLTAFSSDLSASSSFNYFEVSGSSVAAGDMMYFGATAPWHHLVYNITTKGVNIGVVWETEYWNGAWVALDAAGGNGIDSTFFQFASSGSLCFDGRADWATTAINGETLYWVRIRIISIDVSWTSSPVQGGQVIYTPSDTYISLANTVLDGDLPAITKIKVLNNGTDLEITHAIMGIKSRGLTAFTSRINAGASSLNSVWTIAHSTDTGNAADPLGPDGQVSRCTFATDQTMIVRNTMTCAQASAEDYEGTYAVFVRAEQQDGVAGDVELQVRQTVASAGGALSNIDSEKIPMTLVDSGPEAVYMGIFSFAAFEVRSDERYSIIYWKILAKSNNGTTPEVNIHDLVMIPIDEWACTVAEPRTITDAPLGSQDIYYLDSGVTREGAHVFSSVDHRDDALLTQVINRIEARGQLPKFEPNRTIRLYFLFHYSQQAPAGQGAAISLFFHERWAFLRGGE